MQDENMITISDSTVQEIMEVGSLSLDIIIPTYKPDDKFDRIMDRLQRQSVKPDHIYIINTEEEFFDHQKYGSVEGVTITHIKKSEFDHGGTRNYGASLSDADIIMFMTQDAVPADVNLLLEMKRAFLDERTAAAYGRQLSSKRASEIEKYTRNFNYPPKDMVKSKKDLDKLGIKTYFCSNACAAYRREVYLKLGGFVTKTIFNEDMIMASKIIEADYQIAYASKALVIHSHEYSYWQQFTRNFDLGVSQKEYEDIFKSVKSEDEGIKLVKQTAKHLSDTGKGYLIPDLILQSGFKYAGYKAGLHYNMLPKEVVKIFSMNASYWEERD